MAAGFNTIVKLTIGFCLILKRFKGVWLMNRSILHFENRIAKLKATGEMKNANLIRKAERQLRKREKSLAAVLTFCLNNQ